MANDNWYRNTHWDKKIAKTFFEKLSRTRSQRDQYLVIQALTLAESAPTVSLELVDLYFDTKKEDFEDVRALLARADALLKLEKVHDAIHSYKDVLARETERPSHTTTTYVRLPYLIAYKEVDSEYDFALSVLAAGVKDLAFPVDVFLWRAASALIASAQGRTAESVEHARRAIEAAGVKKSGFRYHQNVGLVGKEHQGVMKKLVKLAR